MCINCNLIAPLSHGVCHFLGIPINTYGASSRALYPLARILDDLDLQRTNYMRNMDGVLPRNYEPRDVSRDYPYTLYSYLKRHNMYEELIDMVNEQKSSNCVDLSYINYVLYKYFEVHFEPDKGNIRDKLRVPIELLTNNALTEQWGAISICQRHLIPTDLVVKYKLTQESMLKYGICPLPSQTFYDVRK